MRRVALRNGFTMLELVFVIVILGIVSSIGASIIVSVYQSYIVQRALHIASTKADLAAKQIAARLTYRISPSVIGREIPADGGGYKTIEKVDPGDNYRILEWFGYDNDSFAAYSQPGWSGFCDVDHTSTTKSVLMTPGSKLSDTATIIGNLGGTTTDAAIIFNSREYSSNQNYHACTMGFLSASYDGLSGDCDDANPTISPVLSFTGDTQINVSDSGVVGKVLKDQYKLVWSAYAIVPEKQTDNTDTSVKEDKLFNLNLYYNYQPWLNQKYSEGQVSTLVRDVTVFKFKGLSNTLRFKICVQEKISGSRTVNACKEKVVIR